MQHTPSDSGANLRTGARENLRAGININPDMTAFSASFDSTLKKEGQYPLTAQGVLVLQVNMGRLCNLSCKHCHVEAGPARTELMPEEVMRDCLKAIKTMALPEVDITGGSPELNPHYLWFIKELRQSGCRVKTRTNLTVLVRKEFHWLPEFWAENKVEVVASLPHYLKDTTDKLRGSGAFDASIEAVKRLNRAGYGVPGSGLKLNLVFNPCGAFLPPAQRSIEADFRKELLNRHGISFSSLLTITNMPVGRFMTFLRKTGNLERYMDRLMATHNPLAAENVMCKHLISVGWDGALYDCDFNQALGLKCDYGAPDDIKNFDIKTLSSRRIVTGWHCFGCTSGAGSSCAGAIT